MMMMMVVVVEHECKRGTVWGTNGMEKGRILRGEKYTTHTHTHTHIYMKTT
jgi:hypothetical protein